MLHPGVFIHFQWGMQHKIMCIEGVSGLIPPKDSHRERGGDSLGVKSLISDNTLPEGETASLVCPRRWPT